MQRRKGEPPIPNWYWILLGSAGDMNTDYAEKKGSQDHGATEMNKDIQAMYKIFKTNPKVKSDGSY